MLRRTAALAQSVDWTALAAKVHTDSAKQAVMSLKATVARIDSQYKAASTAPPEIDFNAWRAKVQNKDAVTALEVAYKKRPLPKLYAAPLKADAARTDALWKVIEEKVLEAKTKATAVQQQIDSLDATKLRETTTIEDVYKWYPHLQAEIDAEIANEEWFVDTILPKTEVGHGAAAHAEGGTAESASTADVEAAIEAKLPPAKELLPEEAFEVLRAWHKEANPNGPELPSKDDMASFYKKRIQELHAEIAQATGK